MRCMELDPSGPAAGSARALGARLGVEKPLLDVTGRPGRLSKESLRELWRFREVLWAFLVRLVRVRYKQAMVGIGWAVLQPILAAVIFAVFLGQLSQLGSEGEPYLLFALAGMVAWTYFSTACGTAIDSLIINQDLLRKIYFPREVLPLASIGAALIDLIPGLATLVVAGAAFGVRPSTAWLAAPIPIVVLVIAAAGFSLALSAVNVYYRDVRYALPFVLSLGLFASPVVYSVDVVPERWRDLYMILNPIAAAIDAFRQIFVHGAWPDFKVQAGAMGWALAVSAASFVVFKRLERDFSDRV